MKSIDKLRDLAMTPEKYFNLFLEKVGMKDADISVTSDADLIVTNLVETKQYTYEQFIDITTGIKSN